MNDREQALLEIEQIVSENPKNVDPEIRKRFWKLVRQIKRTPKPDSDEVAVASRIRNQLFEASRGRIYPLWPSVGAFFLLGLIFPTIWYLRLLFVPLDTSIIFSWTMSDWWVFLRRLGSLLAATFFFYPLGRLIAGKWAGIRIDGMCRGMYSEPTLKIEYESFLLASPPKRKWFFFFAGAWTIITLLLLGSIGWLIAGDISGIITVVFLTVSEGAAIISGTTKNVGGEMAHYNRERKIERAWKRKLALMENSSKI
ncbi:MAG: hypothetical protein ACW97A_09385 [Candidatus Thorarchaeota archaeon]|jgi:hypothetical protein